MKINLLVEKLKNGDHQAFMAIYDSYFQQIHQFIARYVHADTVAQDLTQDVFVKLWEKKNYLAKVDNFNAYLYRIAKNHTMDYMKKMARLEISPYEVIAEFQFSSNEVELSVTEQEYFQFLEDYMLSLNPKSQQIFELCRIYEKSYQEVADELNISQSTVKHHMVSTMKALKEKIKNRFNINRFRSINIIQFVKMFLPF